MASQALLNFLKVKYDNGKIPRQVYQQYPFLDEVPKFSDGGGLNFTTAVVTGNPEGIGATLAIAQANAGLAGGLSDFKGKQWIVPYGDYDGVVNINDKDIKRARKNEDAFFNWFDEEIDGIWRAFLTHMSYLMFTEAGQYLASGTIHASNGTITLDDPTAIIRFPIGATLQASTASGSSTSDTLITGGNIGYVMSRDDNAGTFVVATSDANAAAGTGGTPTGWNGQTIYLFRQGDFGGTSTPNVIFKGLGSWIPPAAPSSGENFYNVDRSLDAAKLAGFRLLAADVAGMSIRKRIKRAVAIINNRSTTPGITHVVLNKEKWQDLADELEAQGVRILETNEKYGFGTNSIALAAGGGVVNVIGDRACPFSTGYALTMPKDGSCIQMKSIDGFPHIVREDGLEIVRAAAANDYQHRIAAYPAFVVKAPGWNGRFPV